MSKEWWKQTASNVEYLDFAEQERIYREATGDKPWYIGFDSRFAEWCEKNPRSQLVNAKSRQAG